MGEEWKGREREREREGRDLCFYIVCSSEGRLGAVNVKTLGVMNKRETSEGGK